MLQIHPKVEVAVWENRDFWDSGEGDCIVRRPEGQEIRSMRVSLFI